MLSAAFLILLGLMTFVIPQFKTVLEEMVGGELNQITQAVLGVSAWIAYDYGWAVLCGVPFGFVFLTRFLRRFRKGRLVLDDGAVDEQGVRRSLDADAGNVD